METGTMDEPARMERAEGDRVGLRRDVSLRGRPQGERRRGHHRRPLAYGHVPASRRHGPRRGPLPVVLVRPTS